MPPRKSPRILVIDDDKPMRDLVLLHLANEGYEAIGAEDAIAGARLMLESRFDLLILDGHLPHWSGLDFAATLIADSAVPCPPIIFISGRQELCDRAAAMSQACLVKPFRSTELAAAVAACLRSLPASADTRQALTARAA